jgi:hypothetical protein
MQSPLDVCSCYRPPLKVRVGSLRVLGSGAAADARHGPMSGGAGLHNLGELKEEGTRKHDHNTTPGACERRTPWPASAAVETPRCTSPQGLFLPPAPRPLLKTPSPPWLQAPFQTCTWPPSKEALGRGSATPSSLSPACALSWPV